MWRPAILLILAFAFQSVQAQVESHGVPASVLSPTSPGTAHGTPASVNSPTPVQGGRAFFADPRHFRVRFGSSRHHRAHRDFLPVPIFIPAYPLTGDYAADSETPADQAVPDDSGETAIVDSSALREAYNRGAQDAMAAQHGNSRYGEHYLDSRERSPFSPPASKDKKTAKDDASQSASDTEAPAEPVDNGPATVFIFKDGHKLETSNYAIQGQTLFDFSNNSLRKINLGDLDLAATKKVNDDLGISVKFPPAAP